MFRKYAVAVLLCAAAAACGSVNERYREQMFLGQEYYNKGKYYESIGRFTQAKEFAENSDEEYQALLGAGNACVEYGMIIYSNAEDLIRMRNKALGLQKLNEADKWHDNANRSFARLLQLRPNDTVANYSLGLFLYRRATSFSELPYPGTARGMEQRRKERDEGIRQFEIVLKGERGDITVPEHGPKCHSAHAHRYLALTLFARSDWDLNDGEAARRHLLAYLNFVSWSRDYVAKNAPQTDEMEKSAKQRELDRLKKELTDTQALLRTQLAGLKEVLAVWEGRTVGKDIPMPPAAKHEAWTNAARREIAALETLRRGYEAAARAEQKDNKP
jgi:tetratricopeptide (TPR) repeat protein